jgi:hypothetical protein
MRETIKVQTNLQRHVHVPLDVQFRVSGQNKVFTQLHRHTLHAADDEPVNAGVRAPRCSFDCGADGALERDAEGGINAAIVCGLTEQIVAPRGPILCGIGADIRVERYRCDLQELHINAGSAFAVDVQAKTPVLPVGFTAGRCIDGWHVDLCDHAWGGGAVMLKRCYLCGSREGSALDCMAE